MSQDKAAATPVQTESGVKAEAAAKGAGGGGAPGIPAAVQKVVDAFFGEWTFHIRLMLPGATAVRTTTTRFCARKIANGYGVELIGHGDLGEMGKYEEAVLVSYDVGEQLVRFMNVTSLGQVNDFQGRWENDNTIVFAPLKTWRMGKRATVNWSIHFIDAHNMTFQQQTAMEDGTTSSVEATARRESV